MTDADREIKRLISYIRSCREANIDCTVTIDKGLTHCVLNALKEVQQYRKIGTVEECRESREKQKKKRPIKILVDPFEYDYDYVCPNCRNELDGPALAEYCHHCGQAIKWKETK